MATAQAKVQGWLESGRSRALAAAARLPLPSRSDERFKHTGLADVNLGLAEAPAKVELAGPALPAEAVSAAALSPEALTWLEEISAAEPTDKFAALAAGKAAAGAFFHAPKGQKLTNDARALCFAAGGASTFFRSYAVAERDSESVFVEDFEGTDGKGVAAGLTDIFVGENAVLHYVTVQNFGAGTDFFLRRRLRLAKGASVRYYALSVGGRKGQEALEANLAGEGAEFLALAAAQASGKQHLDFVANYNHRAPHTMSGLDHWAVMSGESRGVFNGLVHVETSALHTDAYQKSRALLLSRTATMHAMPKLIIATDEVACSHGASVSRVDPDQLFYLMSRGIDESEATRIIVSGFTEPVIGALPSEAMQERFRTLLERKLDDGT